MKLISPIDFKVDQWLWHGRAEWPAQAFYYFTYLGEAYFVAVVTVIAVVYLWFKTDKAKAYGLAVSAVGSVGTVLMLKHLIARPRPVHSFYAETLASFPSAHATLAVAVYGLLFYYLISSVRQPWQKTALHLISALFILLLGFSRLYLGVHYLSDVVAGYAVGFVWLTAGVLVEKNLKD